MSCTRIPALLTAGSLALVAALSARADYASTVLGDHPLAYYRFNESPVVTVGYPMATNLGTLGAAANGADAASASVAITKGAAGALADPSNTAFHFPGLDNNRVVVPHLSDLAYSGPFTIEFWAKPDSADFACPAAMMKYAVSGNEDGNRYGWLIYQSDTSLDLGNGWQIRLYKGSGTSLAGIAQVDMMIVPGNWYHVVAVYTGSTIELYVNGTLQDSEAASGYAAVPFDPYPLSFGSRGYTGSSAYWEYRGALDEVAFYTNALTAGDIAAHYGAAATNGAAYPGLVLAQNPPGYWRFNEVITPLPVAQNSSSAGAAFNGTYQYFSTTAAGLQGPAYPGFESTNEALQLVASPNGYVSAPALNTTLTSATFEGWVKRNGTQPGTAGLILQRNGSTTHGLSFQSDGQQLAYNWNDNAATWGWNSGLTPPDGQWAYVALTVNPSQATLYLFDGTTWSSAANAIPHGAAPFNAETCIGFDSLDAARHYHGQLDEIAIYGQALSAGQLRTHALAGFGDTHPPTFVTDPPVLLTTGTIYSGWPFALSVDAYGLPPLNFQWRKNGNPIQDATNSTYAVNAAASGDSGNYDVIVTNPNGSTTNASTVLVTVVTTPPDVTSSLRTWLKFNESQGLTASDSSGSGRAGSLQGFPGDDSQWAAGCLSNALQMNPYYGAQQVVLVTDDGGLDFATNRAFTLAAWVNADPAAQGANGGIIAKGFGNGQEQYSLDIDGGHYRFFVRDAAGAATVLNSSVAPSGPYWQHVAAVFSAPLGIMKLYVNGVQVASGTPPSTLFTNRHEVSLGARQQDNYDGAPYDFDLVGMLDDARIFGRALVPAEVQALYNLAPLVAPSISQDPQGKSVFQGGSVKLTASAAGSEPLRYQWYRNGTTPVAGATTTTLTIPSVNTGTVGNYTLTATNTAGKATSAIATVALLTAPAGTYENAVVTDTPEAYWRLNEPGGSGLIADSMGRHDGTAFSFGSADGGANFAFGQTGALKNNADTCIQFATSSRNMVRVPYAAALNTSNFTVECWANLASDPGAGTWFAPVGSATSLSGYAIYAGGDDPTWQAWLYLNGSWGVLSGLNWQLGSWVHLAMTYSDQTERLYVNGVFAGSQLRTLVPNTQGTFDIGAGAGNDFAFDGLIDEVAYYPTALSAARIGAHYALGTYGNNSLPVFTQLPAAQTVPVETTVALTPTVAGAPTITYQWQKDGVALPGKTDLTLTVPDAYYTDAGQYTLAATNGVGGVVSLPIQLTVMPPASQTNLVLRTKADTNGAVLELIWPAGTLYSAPTLTGPWSPVSSASLPYYTVSPTNSALLFRRE